MEGLRGFGASPRRGPREGIFDLALELGQSGQDFISIRRHSSCMRLHINHTLLLLFQAS